MLLPVGEIARLVHAEILVVPADAERMVCGITWDSREVQPGFAYLALPGQRVDGHSFAAAAVQAGAACVLVQHDLSADALEAARNAGAAVYQVSSTAKAFTALASGWRTRLNARVVGITGSTGKTTTKNLVRDVLASSFNTVATKANQNNELGVPRTLLAADPDTEMVVVEMGMRGAGQIRQLCEFVCPDWGLVTNVGESHIELLGSRENIAHAKAELVASLQQGGIAFVNGACDMADVVVADGIAGRPDCGVACVCFDGSGAYNPVAAEGWRGAPAVWAEDVSLDGGGCPSFTLCASGFAPDGGLASGSESKCIERVSCRLSLRGYHNVSNACSAAAVGLAAGIPLAQCAQALAASQPESGRQEVLCSKAGITVVNDAYNANPDSMRASLLTFESMQVAGRRFAVLGDMGELGSFAAEGHARVGAMAAAMHPDCLVTVGDLARTIASSARERGLQKVYECATPEEALIYLKDNLVPGDAVLVKASHSVGLDAVARGLVG